MKFREFIGIIVGLGNSQGRIGQGVEPLLGQALDALQGAAGLVPDAWLAPAAKNWTAMGVFAVALMIDTRRHK